MLRANQMSKTSIATSAEIKNQRIVSTCPNGCTENVRVLAVVILKLELVHVERKILAG